MTLTIFLMLRAETKWLRLTRAARNELAGAALGRAFGAHPGLSLSHFDAEAFHARISDIAVIEAEDPQAYYFAIEALRDSPLLAEDYFTLVEVVPAYEDGFRHYEAA